MIIPTVVSLLFYEAMIQFSGIFGLAGFSLNGKKAQALTLS
jgi:hypothetical protein